MQLVEIVEINVRFHLSQNKTNQSIVMTVFLTTDQKEMTEVEADLVETAVVVEVVVEADLETEDHEKCIQPPV